MKTTIKHPSILPTLEAAANQILAAVAPTTSRLVRVEVIISDGAETAYTDGTVRITMPTTFCGVTVADEVKLAVGLLVHEVGHFLQPLEAVTQVEEAQQIPRWLTNVVLDVQGESLLQSLFPTFKRPLAEVRRTVQKAMLSAYVDEIAKATSFVEAAGPLALWGRFVKPMLPFCADNLPPRVYDQRTCQRFLSALDRFRTCPARELPQWLHGLIADFPELCQARIPHFPQGMDGLHSHAPGALGGALRREAGTQTGGLAGGGDNAEIQVRPVSPVPPQPEAMQLARTLRTRFQATHGGVEVLAPGRFERRAAARGELPLRMALPGKERPAPKLVLCLDASGSMNAPCPGTDHRTKWAIAQVAAQAVALSVRASGGSVVAVVFADSAWRTPNGDDLPLGVTQERNRAWVGSGTCFRFLTELWRRYPDHPFLVLTDGSGNPPDAVLNADRKRTHALIIPRGEADQAKAWSGRQVVLADLRHLASVMAMLIPRRSVG